MKKRIEQVTVLITQGLIFGALVSFMLAKYPLMDEFIFLSFGKSFNLGLTVYHPMRYGPIHYSSIILTLWVVGAAVAAPHLQRLLDALIRLAITKWQENRELIFEK